MSSGWKETSAHLGHVIDSAIVSCRPTFEIELARYRALCVTKDIAPLAKRVVWSISPRIRTDIIVETITVTAVAILNI